MPFGDERRARHHPPDRLRRPRAATSTSSRRSSPSAPARREKRADLVLLVNGIPLVVIEAKTPVRASQSWLDGALQVHDDYEQQRPRALRAERVLRRHRGQGVPLRLDRACRSSSGGRGGSKQTPTTAGAGSSREGGRLDAAAARRARPARQLHGLRHRQEASSRIKIIARYQQYEAPTRSSSAWSPGSPKKGLIWHFQGSGKSLLMVFAARKLRLHPALKNPTVLIVVDRIDLDTQISSTFYAADMPNLVKADSRAELQRPARAGRRARSSSRRSTSSARPTACSTTAATSS